MPTGLKQWAELLGLPVSLEAAIREQQLQSVPAKDVDDIIKFYKTNSAKKKAELDRIFLQALIEAEAEDEEKADIDKTIIEIVNMVIEYFNEGPDLPDTPIKAFRQYLNKETADQFVTYWAALEPNDIAGLIGQYNALLNNSTRVKMEKEQDVRNFVYTFDKITKTYFLPPLIKLLREVLKDYSQLIGQLQDFYDQQVHPTIKQQYNETVKNAIKLPEGIVKNNALLETVLRFLTLYSQVTSDPGIEIVRLEVLKRMQPLEGQPKSAGQLQDEEKAGKTADAFNLAQANLTVAYQQAAQQNAGSDPQGLLSQQGEQERRPFGSLTNPEAKKIIRNILPLKNLDTTKATKILTRISKLQPKDIIAITNDKATPEGKREFITYDLQIFLASDIFIELGQAVPFITEINNYAKKRGYDSARDLIDKIRVKLAENAGILAAYQGVGGQIKSFKTRLRMLMGVPEPKQEEEEEEEEEEPEAE